MEESAEEAQQCPSSLEKIPLVGQLNTVNIARYSRQCHLAADLSDETLVECGVHLKLGTSSGSAAPRGELGSSSDIADACQRISTIQYVMTRVHCAAKIVVAVAGIGPTAIIIKRNHCHCMQLRRDVISPAECRTGPSRDNSNRTKKGKRKYLNLHRKDVPFYRTVQKLTSVRFTLRRTVVAAS